MGKIKRERQKFHITSTVDDDANIPMETGRVVPKYNRLPMAPMQSAVSENIFAGVDIQLDKVNKFSEPEQPPPPPSAEPSVQKDLLTRATEAFGPPPTGKPGRQMTKKEKMKLKHEKLLQKIDVVQQAKRNHEKKKKKKKAKNSGQHELLPPLHSLFPLELKDAKTGLAREPQTRKEILTTMPVCSPLSGLFPSQGDFALLNDSLPSLDSIFHLKSKDAKTGLEQSMTLKSKQQKRSKARPQVDLGSVQSSSKTIMKDTKKDVKKEYVKSYDLFRKLLKTAKTTSNPTKLPKQKKYPKKLN